MVPNMTSCRGGVGSATLGKTVNLIFSISLLFVIDMSGGRIYSVGGHDGSTYLKTVEAYDLENQQSVNRFYLNIFVNIVIMHLGGYQLQVSTYAGQVLVYLSVT